MDLLLSQTEKKNESFKHSLNPVRNSDSGNREKATQDIVHSIVIHNIKIYVSLPKIFSPIIVKFGVDTVRSQGSHDDPD